MRPEVIGERWNDMGGALEGHSVLWGKNGSEWPTQWCITFERIRDRLAIAANCKEMLRGKQNSVQGAAA